MDAQELDEKMKKLKKKLENTFIEDVRKADNDKLREDVVKYSKRLEDIDEEKRKDGKLISLKEDLKALNGGYRDVKKAASAKEQYIILTLMERGNL